MNGIVELSIPSATSTLIAPVTIEAGEVTLICVEEMTVVLAAWIELNVTFVPMVVN